MEEKYVAILFEKMNYDIDKGLFIFKPIEVLNECTLDLEKNILTSATGVEYLDIEDETLSFSEQNLCYGYPMTIDNLKFEYPEINNENEIIKEYYDELSSNIYFGTYDSKLKRIKLVLAPKDLVNEMEEDSWFYDFDYEQYGEEENIIISKDNFDRLIQCIENADYDTISCYFKNINSLLETVLEPEFFCNKYEIGGGYRILMMN